MSLFRNPRRAQAAAAEDDPGHPLFRTLHDGLLDAAISGDAARARAALDHHRDMVGAHGLADALSAAERFALAERVNELLVVIWSAPRAPARADQSPEEGP